MRYYSCVNDGNFGFGWKTGSGIWVGNRYYRKYKMLNDWYD